MKVNNSIKALFSVGPIEGLPSTTTDYGCKYVSQRAQAFEGLTRVIADEEDFFGNGKPFRDRVVDSPSWGQMKGAATRQMRATGDEHHAFFEDAYVVGTEIDKQGRTVKLIRLDMGS